MIDGFYEHKFHNHEDNSNATGYTRISTQDQSNYSLAGQEEHIRSFCEKRDYNLLKVYEDKGQSAGSFDRKNWKELERTFAKDWKNISYLIVLKYDRFSRNMTEALVMIQEIEEKLKIRILSVMEPIGIDPPFTMFFQMRAQMLLNAHVELMVIKGRVKFGFVAGAKQ